MTPLDVDSALLVSAWLRTLVKFLTVEEPRSKDAIHTWSVPKVSGPLVKEGDQGAGFKVSTVLIACGVELAQLSQAGEEPCAATSPWT